MRTGAKRLGLSVLALCLLLSGTALSRVSFPATGMAGPTVHAETRYLSLEMAQSLATASSSKIKSLKMQKSAKIKNRESAVKSLKEKQSNMSTIRWSPIVSFKLPSKPDEAEAYTFQFKPIQLNYGIEEIEHKIIDQELSERNKVSTAYVEMYKFRMIAEFDQSRVDAAQEALEKLTAKQAVGAATQAQVTAAKKTVTKLKQAATTARTQEKTNAQKLQRLVGLNPEDYELMDPFVHSAMERDMIPSLINYTKEHDKTYYDAQTAAEMALIALQVNRQLFTQQYGGDMKRIEQYLVQAEEGTQIDQTAFSQDYELFLKDIDSYWKGDFHVWLLSFSREYIKGAIDGVRFVEDDPEVLYTAALDYQSARQDLENAGRDVEDAVADAFDNFAATRKSYLTLKEQVRAAQITLAEDEVKFLLGLMTEDEYVTESEEYDSMQQELITSLAQYSQAEYALDRTTCGGAAEYFATELTDVTASAGNVAAASLKPVFASGATYTIRDVVSDNQFILYVHIPEGFRFPIEDREVEVTDFELWCDGERIGNKTPVTEGLKHLKLAISGVEEVKIRLFAGEEALDDIVIDETLSFGPLQILTQYEEEEEMETEEIGSIRITQKPATGQIELTMNFLADLEIDAYRLVTVDGGTPLVSEEAVAANQPFSYLAAIQSDIEEIEVRCLDADGNELFPARIDAGNDRLYALKDEVEKRRGEIAERKRLAEEEAARRAAEEAAAIRESENQAAAAEAERQRKATQERLAAAIEVRAGSIEHVERVMTSLIEHRIRAFVTSDVKNRVVRPEVLRDVFLRTYDVDELSAQLAKPAVDAFREKRDEESLEKKKEEGRGFLSYLPWIGDSYDESQERKRKEQVDRDVQTFESILRQQIGDLLNEVMAQETDMNKPGNFCDTAAERIAAYLLEDQELSQKYTELGKRIYMGEEPGYAEEQITMAMVERHLRDAIDREYPPDLMSDWEGMRELLPEPLLAEVQADVAKRFWSGARSGMTDSRFSVLKNYQRDYFDDASWTWLLDEAGY
ncbi:MAG: TolC family protein [Lachnospiraceae bacterium]|nr:TolC family protein [Lachnospiraceae bacterium]